MYEKQRLSGRKSPVGKMLFADVYSKNKWGKFKAVILFPKNDPKTVELAAALAGLKNTAWAGEEPPGPYKDGLRTDGKYGDPSIEYWAEFTTGYEPKVVDLQGQGVSQCDLRGCQVRVMFDAETWENATFGSGIKMYLNGLQLVANSQGPGRSTSEVAAMFAAGEPENTSSAQAPAPAPAQPPAEAEDVPF